MSSGSLTVGCAVEVGRTVTVAVSATSANLGPGFDCLGLALDWREQVDLTVRESGFVIEVSGEGADRIPRDESHLIIRSVLVGLADLGVPVPGLGLAGHNTIPHGRGLGSSSAAVVAGLVAAAGLAQVEVDPAWVLRHATAIEGHPDNVAAAVYGGLVLAYEGPNGVQAAQGRLHPEIGAAVLIPESAVETARARGLLPEQVPHTDAAANTGRAALLVHALADDPDRLLDATRDWLHQQYREPVMPRSYALVTALRAAGYAAVISGAGPTVLVLGRRDQLAALEAFPAAGFGLRHCGIGPGATLLGSGHYGNTRQGC
jgi:homoserine kinase